MSDGIWAALSGAVGQVRALDVAANNLANTQTTGFRADRAIFREYLAKATATRPAALGLSESMLDGTVADLEKGAIVQTGRPLDVAVKDDAWLVVQSPAGERYTRAGNLQVGGDGTLSTRDGSPYLGEGRVPIRVPPGAADVRIAADGSVVAGSQTLGRLLTVKFDAGTSLSHDGAQLVQAIGPSAPREVEPSLSPGSLEQSTSKVVDGMIDVVAASRAFEACQKAIESFSEVDKKAITLMQAT